MCQQVIRGPVLNVLDSFNTFQAKDSPFYVDKKNIKMIPRKYVTAIMKIHRKSALG